MKTCSLRESDPLAPANLEAMLAFIPALEASDFCPGHVIPIADDGLPEETFLKGISRFMDACYKNGMVVRFDWEQWDSEARGYLTDPARLAQADLPLLRRLLTWHVRQNRYAKDHLATMMANGHILCILKRMKEVS